MSLVRYLRGPETLDDLESAAHSRVLDGRALRAAERPYWAIYTLGYVAECCLKAAFLRLCGYAERDSVSGMIRFAPAWGRQFGLRDSNLHNLIFWMEILKREREFLGKPFSHDLTAMLAARVQMIAVHWRVDMRYRGSLSTCSELRQVLTAAMWIFGNRRVLWS